MRKPRLLLVFIVFLTFFTAWISFPVGQDKFFGLFKSNQRLFFRQGLDLQGGSSIVFRADMSKIDSAQKENALNSAKTVIEKRVNLYGVSEPVVNTVITNGDYRINLELPGVDVSQAKSIVGTTAELSFWEQVLTPSEDGATPSATLKRTNLSGNDLKNTNVTFDPNTGQPQVQLVFTNEGAKKFADITGRNIGKPLAIILDGQLIQSPVVNQQIFGGNAVISGGFTTEQANALSTELNAGALPVPLAVLYENSIGPTLGQSSLQKSLFAGFLGFVTIVVFMSILYGRLGIVASLALVLYVLINLAIFKLSNLTPYGITLTLSGIAGFVLSVGMAVDANVLIFERMKEERRLGKTPERVLELGFQRAWSSIRDSNISTLITSIILYQFGTGTIRGFALILAIGVLVSMFSAVVVTRTLLKTIYGHN